MYVDFSSFRPFSPFSLFRISPPRAHGGVVVVGGAVSPDHRAAIPEGEVRLGRAEGCWWGGREREREREKKKPGERREERGEQDEVFIYYRAMR